MDEDLYIEHATLFVRDANEKAPGNRWLLRHAEQGFARRPEAMNIAAVFDEDGYVADLVHGEHQLSACEKLVEFSLLAASGKIVLSGTDTVDVEIWRGESGWVRVAIGQQLLDPDEPPRIRVVVVASSAAADAPTRLWLHGAEVTAEFVEEAEVQTV